MKYFFILCIVTLFFGCRPINSKLVPVTYADFEAFVEATDYVTDAEKYGWSIVQQDVFNFVTVDSATWREPDGKIEVTDKQLPVTQVSYNDAKAYCEWSGTRLPTYNEYWQLTQNDKRIIATENIMPISPVDKVNIVGNVWDITEPLDENSASIRLVGGSIFCAPATCDGTQKSRKLLVDRETGNIHIGFAVVQSE